MTSLTASAQQVMTSFAVAGLTTVLANKMENYMAGGAGPKAVYSAYGDTFFVVMCIAVVGAVLGLMLRRPKKGEEPGEDKKAEAAIAMGH